MTTPKKSPQEKPQHPALAALADRIEEMAHGKAKESLMLVCTRLSQIRSNHGISTEMLQVAIDNLDKFDTDDVVPLDHLYLEKTRQDIINSLVKAQEKKEKF